MPHFPLPLDASTRNSALPTTIPELKTFSNWRLPGPLGYPFDLQVSDMPAPGVFDLDVKPCALGRNLLPALVSPALEHVLAIRRFHPHPKAVSLAPVAVIGLIRSFHRVFSLARRENYTRRLRQRCILFERGIAPVLKPASPLSASGQLRFQSLAVEWTPKVDL